MKNYVPSVYYFLNEMAQIYTGGHNNIKNNAEAYKFVVGIKKDESEYLYVGSNSNGEELRIKRITALNNQTPYKETKDIYSGGIDNATINDDGSSKLEITITLTMENQIKLDNGQMSKPYYRIVYNGNNWNEEEFDEQPGVAIVYSFNAKPNGTINLNSKKQISNVVSVNSSSPYIVEEQSGNRINPTDILADTLQLNK